MKIFKWKRKQLKQKIRIQRTVVDKNIRKSTNRRKKKEKNKKYKNLTDERVLVGVTKQPQRAQ